MTDKKTVLIITGSRSDYSWLRPIIYELKKSNYANPKILVTGSHLLSKFGNSVEEIFQDGFEIDAKVKISPKDDMIGSLVKEIRGIHKYCKANKVDLMLLMGDRDEVFAGAIVAGHLGIPIGHINGGNITGYVVDEAIRHSITKFSHLHFVASKKSFSRVLQLGEEKWRVFNVGATVLDDLENTRIVSKQALSKILGLNARKKWFTVLHHPTPLEKVSFIAQIRPLLRAVCVQDGEKVIIYPNSDTGSGIFISEIEKYRKRENFHLFKNLKKELYLNLLARGDLLIGNSSSGFILESSYFKIPTVNVGGRQKGRERGSNVIDCGYGEESISNAINSALSREFVKKCKNCVNPYGRGEASKKIVRIIEKYLDNDNLVLKKFSDEKKDK
jgi:UDP-hydrolysing UDP-N-acetyl-D-glucosamine 2-epimerase